MIRQAVILADTQNGSPAADPAWLERLTAQIRRHGVEDIEISPPGGAGFRDLAPQLAAPVFALDGGGLLDINLWDLALAAGQESALAVTPGGRSAGVAVLDGAMLRQLAQADLDPFAALAADEALPRRVYDRPPLNLAADTVRGAVIFDRDGVLNEDTAFPHRPDQIVWTPTAKAAVKAVNDAGLYALVATNQSGVARGLFGERDVIDLHAWMNGELIAAGAHIDAFEYSPFHPEATVEAYRRDSDCRKPGAGMLSRMIDAYPIDRRRTVMIGDRQSDVAAGVAAGVEGLLFEGGDLAAFLGPVITRLAV
jgi:D-glycero-D-manno-heptose 1,7-bisphosphate phosphatase